MSHLYFIGGTALGGKSEISTAFLESLIPHAKKAPQYIGTDAIRRILWTTIAENTEPALFQMHKDRRKWSEKQWLKQAETDPFYWVDRQHTEQEVVWRRGILPAIECNVDRGLSTLIEGIAVLPQFLAKFSLPYRAVFVGNNKITAAHRANVHKTAHAHRDHWMSKWSTHKIDTYLDFVAPAYAKRLQELCHKHGFDYFDLSEGDYKENQQRAYKQLLGSRSIITTAPAG